VGVVVSKVFDIEFARRTGRDWARIVGCQFLASGVIAGGVVGTFGVAGHLRIGSGA